MPQELRISEKRTERAMSDVSKILEFNSIVNLIESPIVHEWAADVLWPGGLTNEEKLITISSMIEIQNMSVKESGS